MLSAASPPHSTKLMSDSHSRQRWAATHGGHELLDGFFCHPARVQRKKRLHLRDVPHEHVEQSTILRLFFRRHVQLWHLRQAYSLCELRHLRSITTALLTCEDCRPYPIHVECAVSQVCVTRTALYVGLRYRARDATPVLWLGMVFVRAEVEHGGCRRRPPV